jgi:hypothetical protein
MQRFKHWFLIAAVVLLPAAGWSAGDDEISVPPEFKNQDVFCEGTYALCIKAPCSAIPTLDRLGNYAIDHALCSCDVIASGWSMGPGACSDRAPVEQNGRTYLISTYSNLYNDKNLTLSCASASTLWAWCYGAPCVVDVKDPSKAECNCPVLQSPMKTLGGNCRPDACSGIWSAAKPHADTFANLRFAQFARQHGQPAPPAQSCPVNTPVK